MFTILRSHYILTVLIVGLYSEISLFRTCSGNFRSRDPPPPPETNEEDQYLLSAHIDILKD